MTTKKRPKIVMTVEYSSDPNADWSFGLSLLSKLIYKRFVKRIQNAQTFMDPNQPLDINLLDDFINNNTYKIPIPESLQNSIFMTEINDTEYLTRLDGKINEINSNKDLAKSNVKIDAFCSPIDRIKLSTLKKERIAILPDKAFVLKTHFNQQHGYFLCFGGNCCHDEKFTLKYLLPAFKYDTDKRGEVISQLLSLVVLVLSDEQFSEIAEINQSENRKGGISAFDFIIKCTDEYLQIFSMKQAGITKWRSFDELEQVRDLAIYWTEHRHECYMSVDSSLVE